MTTDTLTLGVLTLVAKQDGPYLRANVSGEGGFLGQLHFTVAEWTSLRALVDVLSAADKRHAEDRAEIERLRALLETHKDLEVKRVNMIGKLSDRRFWLREALDQLHRDIDGYGQTFQHAEWIAAGKPGDFSAWLDEQRKETDER